jgi:hypothetical protein
MSAARFDFKEISSKRRLPSSSILLKTVPPRIGKNPDGLGPRAVLGEVFASLQAKDADLARCANDEDAAIENPK